MVVDAFLLLACRFCMISLLLESLSCHRLKHRGGCLQKIEEPVRSVFPEGSDSGAQNFGASQGEADDFLKSKKANQDTEIFGTEVGVADAMRFKGAGMPPASTFLCLFYVIQCDFGDMVVPLQLLR